ncbi:hypothetical protein HFD88_008089 [Aspergillus terreus]|nr:hypothetical protein HFD88_008089 [Aspergillus terreus]
MTWDRVIQDSDDEDDPLAADFPPPARPQEPQPARDNENPANQGAVDNESADASNQIAVNFDEFLQSQEAAQSRLTSSQQRREERWIPANGEGGSIGTMMNEIGLAQQRLFDEEEAHHAHAHAHQHAVHVDVQNGFHEGTETYRANHPGPDVPSIHYSHPDASCPPTIPYTNGPSNGYTGPPYAQQLDAHAQPHSILSSNDDSRSAPSYNLFESSLQPSTTSYDQSNPFSLHNPTGPERIHPSPRRCNSAREMISSPHDTEPNSSIVRARSDNALAEFQQSVPAQSIAELSVPPPVTIEIPPAPAEKKRGRKKKQSLPDADEDDELAQPATTTATSVVPNLPEKRRGRPPKNAKKETEDAADAIIETYPQPETIPNGASATAEQPTVTIPSEPPNPTTREPKKKKIKRGKTTSLALHKTYASDVEDDVIWVDERPANIMADEPNNHAPSDNNTVEVGSETNPEPAPAPRKRGRKRKKTSEQPIEEKSADPAAEQVQTEPETPVVPEDADKTVPDESTTNNTELPSDLQPSSPTKTEHNPPDAPPVTPKKSEPQTPDPSSTSNKGPTKHSPISTTSKVPYRVGLSRRARIAPLLKIVRR